MDKVMMISGGFDPLHGGHIDYIQAAAKQCSHLIVVLNSDEWLMRKKGYLFMPFEERCKIILAMEGVHGVIPGNDDDGTVVENIKSIKPDLFGNGGDRYPNNTPEQDICDSLGIPVIYGLGGEKTNSSSILAPSGWVNRDWGRYTIIAQGDDYISKMLEFDGTGKTSIQRHLHRTETWMCIDGEIKIVVAGVEHRLLAGDRMIIKPHIWHQAWGTGKAIEVWEGLHLAEDDIVRKQSWK